MTIKQIEIIKALAEVNMNASKVATLLHYHRNTIQYHLQSIEESTGLCPKNFYDLCELLKMIKETEGNAE